MADETNEPAQTEGAGQTAKSRPEPVNLAMIEAAQRGLDLDSPPPEPKTKERGKATPPPAPPAPEPVEIEVRSPDEIEPVDPDEPEPSTPPVATDESADSAPAPVSAEPEGTDQEKLATLAEAASKGRISPNDEDRATKLMREFIKAGQPIPALEAMSKVPWILGVRAAEQAWPSLDESARAGLLDGIVALEGDNAARLRLSLSRSLAKTDLAAGLRLASLTCRNLWNGERGALSPEHSKLIGNVFIGRGKPWVLQLPLAGLPPEEAAPIASCAVFSAFNVNNPPITQLSVLRYAATLLGSLHENLLTLVARGVSRWSGKWQNALRKEVGELPPILATALKQDRGGEPAAPEAAEAPAEEVELPLPPELEEKLKAAAESGDAEQVAAANLEVNTWREANRPVPVEKKDAGEEGAAPDEGKRGRRQRGRDRDRDRNEPRQERQERNDRPERPEKKERPAYVPRDQARDNRDSRDPREARESRDPRDNRDNEPAPRSGSSFNLSSALKQIESHVQQLRNELATTQAKLRKADTGRRTDRVSLSVEEANLSPDELRRLILQLEARNAELQSQVQELLADTEARVQSMGMETGGPVPDAVTQLRSLIAIKIQDGYADFIALEKGAPDVIIRQHYRGLLREIFAQLICQGVPLVGDLPPPPPAPMPPPPPPPMDDSEEDDDDEEEIIEPEPISEDALDDEDDEEYVAPEQDEPVDEESATEDEPPAEDEGEDAEASDQLEPTEPLHRDESAELQPPADLESSEPATEKGPEDAPPAAENS